MNHSFCSKLLSDLLPKIAASLNYCRIGAAPADINAADLEPTEIPREASGVRGEVVTFPAATLCEFRADWKFMKVRKH